MTSNRMSTYMGSARAAGYGASGHTSPNPPRLAYYNDGDASRPMDVSPSVGTGSHPRQPTPRTQQQRRRSASHSSNGNPHANYNLDGDGGLVDSRPLSARGQSYSNRRQEGRGRQSPQPPSAVSDREARATGLLVSPGYEDPYGQSFDDYATPARQRDGRYAMDGHPSSTPNRRAGASDHPRHEPNGSDIGRAGQFIVRLHCCRDAFSDLQEAGKPRPTTFVAVHTAEERGHSGLVEDDYNPVYNDEFLFTSSRPEKDALVVTLIAAATHPNARDKKVAECVVSLQNIERGVEKEKWVSLVRHPGSAEAYERGEVLISVISEDYGQTKVLSEEEEGVYYDEVHEMLTQHAREQLHRLDWLVGSVAREGPAALSRLRTKLIENNLEPVPLRLVVKEVRDLTAADGRPALVETCYASLTTRNGTEMTTKTVPYRHRAILDQTFKINIRNPETDTISLKVFSAGHKIGEAVVGLTNLQAGVEKELKLMIVRAAETGDAANAGEVLLSLQTNGYSSPHQMSRDREERLRERVLAYLWTYLRDDLHRLDAIVAGIDDEDAFMREWARTVGPERRPRHASLRIRQVRDVFGSGDGSAKAGTGNMNNRVGGAARCYARVTVGPTMQRTELQFARSGELSFSTPIDFTVYDPATDSIEIMLVEEGDGKDNEISRVVLGAAALPRGEVIVRNVRLVTRALTRAAAVQGEITVELVAHDFGVSGEQVLPEARVRYLTERLEATTLRAGAEELHRVPFLVDTAPPGREEETVAAQTRELGAEIAAAPMTVRVLGLKDFRTGSSNCYVKVYLDGKPILRTRDKVGGAVVAFDIGDDNETTVKLSDAAHASLVFKVGQHRACASTRVIARSELALRTMIRGEKNTIWIPLFDGSADAFQPAGKQSGAKGGKGDRSASTATPAFTGNRLSTAQTSFGAAGRTTALLGHLGVMLQSIAFPENTVTEYRISDGGGAKDVSAPEAVTNDVTTLLAKYRPQDLGTVQPLIASCSSIKEAHSELRARMCPRAVGATVYVHVEKVEMSTPEGRAQEEQHGIVVDVGYGGEHQQCRKSRTLERDVLSNRVGYSVARLDVPDPKGALNAPGGRTGTAADGAPPLELRLVAARGRVDASAAAFAPLTGTAGFSAPNSPVRSRGVGGADQSYYNATPSARRTSRGGKNNLTNYLSDSQAAGVRGVGDDTAAAGSPYAYRTQSPPPAGAGYANGATSTALVVSNNNGAGVTSSSYVGGGGMAYYGEIGLVQLSLRALLSSPVYRIGDRLRVPIVRPPIQPSFALTGNHNAVSNARCVVGHITLRVSLATFDSVPAYLRLASRKVMTEVDPAYVHYYERRIGAFLRHCAPAELTDFHYKLYERDVATGRWPVSLHDWLQALTKRFGRETTNAFGPEPPLPFDPEERERLRDGDGALVQLREAAFAATDSDTYSRPAHADGGAADTQDLWWDGELGDARGPGTEPVSASRQRQRTRSSGAGARSSTAGGSRSSRRTHHQTPKPAEPVFSF